jgi:hypothetical protein
MRNAVLDRFFLRIYARPNHLPMSNIHDIYSNSSDGSALRDLVITAVLNTGTGGLVEGYCDGVPGKFLVDLLRTVEDEGFRPFACKDEGKVRAWLEGKMGSIIRMMRRRRRRRMAAMSAMMSWMKRKTSTIVMAVRTKSDGTSVSGRGVNLGPFTLFEHVTLGTRRRERSHAQSPKRERCGGYASGRRQPVACSGMTPVAGSSSGKEEMICISVASKTSCSHRGIANVEWPVSCIERDT